MHRMIRSRLNKLVLSLMVASSMLTVMSCRTRIDKENHRAFCDSAVEESVKKQYSTNHRNYVHDKNVHSTKCLYGRNCLCRGQVAEGFFEVRQGGRLFYWSRHGVRPDGECAADGWLGSLNATDVLSTV